MEIVVPYGGTTYPFTMVGTNPMTTGRSTTVANEIVPLKLVFADGTKLDAGPEVSGLPASPLYVNASYAEGNTQYGDALMRSEFWSYAGNENYHVLLAPPVMEATIEVTVPAADGYTTTGSNGSKIGIVSFAWFIHTIEPEIITQLRIQPTSLTIFATKSTRLLEQGGYCCFKGYHAALNMSSPSGPATFTTAWASVTSQAIETMSHEIAEWMNDPFYTNNVPRWRDPVSGGCAGHQLEVGDPVTGYEFTVGGFKVQDEAFYSWFSRDAPSIGINGTYDLLGKLTSPGKVCP
ncbi:MAG: hypothetical protein GIX02_14270 [Candidatus Eremiobacteraeota bacterium]|nr:hypothetical protein [Candidatus Eremiobacteraeota bacterium]